MNISIRHLKIFLLVCELGNMTAAARQLHIAQPSVSQVIKEIEDYYNTKLFERIGRKIFLTKSGDKLKDYAIHIISLYDKMESDMIGGALGGLLRLGATVTVGSCVLPDLVEKFCRQHEEIRIEAVIDNTQEIEEMLLLDRIDIALVEGNVRSADLVSRKFMNDELILVCAANHHLAVNDSVSITELEHEDFIVREAGSGTRELFESVFAAKNVSWKQLWVSNNSEAIKKAVIRGLGVTIISAKSVREEIASGLLKKMAITEVSFQREFKTVYHRSKYLDAAMQLFLEFLEGSFLDII